MGVIWLRFVPLVVGFGLVVSGVAFWSVPAALVTAGVLLMAAALIDIGESDESA